MHLRTRTYDEGRAELVHALAGFADVKATLHCAQRSRIGARVKELQKVYACNARRPSGSAVIVYQHGVRNLVVLDEGARIDRIPRADHDHFGAELADLVVAVAQLRGVLPAQQSTEVTQEHQDHRLICPQTAERTDGATDIG